MSLGILGLTFLAPLAGIIGAAIALPLLALLYFLKLRRKPMRVSSTLLWEQATHDLQVNVPFRWIRFSWLLLLHLLLLASLLLALARPALDSGTVPTGNVAILIDRSASMGATDAPEVRAGESRSRLEQAKERALEIVDRMGSGARGIVAVYGARPEILSAMTRDRGQLRRAIESIEQTDEAGDLRAALRVVGAALASGQVGEAEPESARLYLLSDGQDAGADPIPAPGLGRAEVSFIRCGPGSDLEVDNTGIVALAARRDFEDPTVVRTFVSVMNTLPRSVETGLTVRVAGTVVASERLLIPAAASDGPGRAAQTFDLQSPGSGVVSVRLARRDSLQSDDSAALVLEAPRQRRVLLVQPNVRARLVDQLPIDALEAIGVSELRVMDAGSYEQEAASGLLWTGVDAVVFDRVRPTTLPPVPSISFGATVPVPGLGVSGYEPGESAGDPTAIAYWKRAHPVLRFASLVNLRVERPMRLSLPEVGIDREGGGRVEEVVELATGRAGPLIGLVQASGVRRIVVAFELADSRWWQDPSFPIFLANALDFLTLSGDDQAGRALKVGEAFSVRPARGVDRVAIDGPASVERAVDPSRELLAERVPMPGLPLAGVYRVAGSEETRALAVNVSDAGESSIATVKTVQIAGEGAGGADIGDTAPREIWEWFILAALVLLAIEWCVFAWRMRV